MRIGWRMKRWNGVAELVIKLWRYDRGFEICGKFWSGGRIVEVERRCKPWNDTMKWHHISVLSILSWLPICFSSYKAGHHRITWPTTSWARVCQTTHFVYSLEGASEWLRCKAPKDESAGSVLKYMTKPKSDNNEADWLLLHTARGAADNLEEEKKDEVYWADMLLLFIAFIPQKNIHLVLLFTKKDN